MSWIANTTSHSNHLVLPLAVGLSPIRRLRITSLNTLLRNNFVYVNIRAREDWQDASA
jgi:hypothetical protein